MSLMIGQISINAPLGVRVTGRSISKLAPRCQSLPAHGISMGRAMEQPRT